MNRRNFLATGLAAAALPIRAAFSAPHEHASAFELDEWSVSDLQRRIANRELTSFRITELYLHRVRSLDRQGPALHSVIETNPDALAIARSLDEEYRAKGPRGPLHGIPVLLKDNIDTGDRMQTTAGSLALVGKPAASDSVVAKRLRAAGAVILGKANLSEWANFRSMHSTSGWSARGGQTRNPYVLDRNPCGSSSGSAVAVSANLCALAVGTETDGSIVCPSSMCGVVGIKPTLGLISRAGIIPIAHSQDTAGPMARTVRDAALLLGALAGADPADQTPATNIYRGVSDYFQFLDPNGLSGARIGVARQYFHRGPHVLKVVESCLDAIRVLGAQIVDPVEISSYDEWRSTETEVLLYEFKHGLNRYLPGREVHVKTLADCIRFNREHKREEMPYFEQELMEQAQEKGPITEKAYRQALATNRQLTRKEGIDAVMKKFKLDAIVAPTAGPAWLTDWANGDHTESGCASPPAVAGYPHITVPAGSYFGLPIGLSFFGAPWSEPKLLKYAYAFEQNVQARRKPTFERTIEFSA
ncbi:MAG: amidase [Bryobacteraceae bacterium]